MLVGCLCICEHKFTLASLASLAVQYYIVQHYFHCSLCPSLNISYFFANYFHFSSQTNTELHNFILEQVSSQFGAIQSESKVEAFVNHECCATCNKSEKIRIFQQKRRKVNCNILDNSFLFF